MLIQIGLSCGLKCIFVRSKHNVTNGMLCHTANLIHFQTMSDVPLLTKRNALLAQYCLLFHIHYISFIDV